MIVKEYISYDCPVAIPRYFPSEVLDLMNDFKIRQIPYIVDGEYTMLLDEMQIDELDFDKPLEVQLRNDFVNPHCYEHQHLLEVVPLFGLHNLTLLPVLNEEKSYAGVLLPEDILSALGASLSPKQEGAIIVLDVALHDYSLSQIAQIVESDDAKILQLFVTESQDKSRLEVIIKVNQTSVARMLQTFYRYNYSVQATYSSTDNLDDLSDRYASFMRFLNI